MPKVTDTCQEFCVDPQAVAQALAKIPDEESLALLSRMFQALGDPSRLKILLSVADRELCVCELGEVLSMSAPAVSHHLRRLKDLGLVRTRRAGKLVYYALDDEHVRVFLMTGLQHATHRNR
jgi:ArsR family transcriptional regulator